MIDDSEHLARSTAQLLELEGFEVDTAGSGEEALALFEEAERGMVPNATWNVRPGPMLDPAGPTFAVLVGEPTLEPSDSIAFIHGGQEVWRIEKLRFGLQERGVGLRDLIVLPPLPDEPDDGVID